MRAVIQRVSWAKVSVNNQVASEIGPGLLTLLGASKGTTNSDLKKLIQKIVHLRIFEDDQQKMNLSLLDIQGEHLIVPQFTLVGDCSKGRRPHFKNAEDPATAEKLIDYAAQVSGELGASTQTGVFGADMKVELLNGGPVTFSLDLDAISK